MVFHHYLLNGYGTVTLITFQDGKPVLRDGKVGTEPECCCGGGGRCCGCSQGIDIQVGFFARGGQQQADVGQFNQFCGDCEALATAIWEHNEAVLAGFLDTAAANGYKCVSLSRTGGPYGTMIVGGNLLKGRCCGSFDAEAEPIWTGTLVTFGSLVDGELLIGQTQEVSIWPCVGPYAYDECTQTTRENCCADFDFAPGEQCGSPDAASVCPEINNFP